MEGKDENKDISEKSKCFIGTFLSETKFSENHFLFKNQPMFMEKRKVIAMLITVMFCFLK